MAKILIVEDSQSSRQKLNEILTGAGHKVVEAKDGIEGLGIITTNKELDLIITDHNMPGYDGISMLEKACAQIGTLKIPVFMLTTETSEVLKDAGRAVGIIAWILKPFTPEKLLAGIEKALSKRN